MRDDSERSEPALDEKGLHPVPYTAVHRVVRRLIEPSQDVLVVVLALVLFGAMLRVILQLGSELVAARFSFRPIIAEALFVLVLIELQRLLILYLRDHHVSVDVMVEATIVGVLREVLLFGAIDIDATRLVALTLFVLALGALLRFGDIRASRRRIHAHGSRREPLLRAQRRYPRPRNGHPYRSTSRCPDEGSPGDGQEGANDSLMPG